jgi:hypothetical protein
MILKHCKKCTSDKPLNEFSECKSSKDGLQYVCRACRRAVGLISDAKRRAKAKAVKTNRVKDCGNCNWYSNGVCAVKNPGETCMVEKHDNCHKWEGLRRVAPESVGENIILGNSLLTKLVKPKYDSSKGGYYGDEVFS